eukprot:GHVS01086940.1.p1 GENE.GHVS01086940.1~~GHVS01086940.1.p1  ORF type:complete len:390 (-),score=55.37 GHVS01086940.1:330-1499(-)
MSVAHPPSHVFSRSVPYRRSSVDAGSFPSPLPPSVPFPNDSSEPIPKAIGATILSRGSSDSSVSTDASPSKMRRGDPANIVKKAVRVVDRMREADGTFGEMWSMSPTEFSQLGLEEQEEIYSAKDLQLTNVTRTLVTVSMMSYVYLVASTGLLLCTGVRGAGSALVQMLFLFFLPCLGIPAARNRSWVMLYLFSFLNVASSIVGIVIWFKQSIICRKVYFHMLPSPPFLNHTKLMYLLTVCLVVLVFATVTQFLASILAHRLGRRVRYFNNLPPPAAPRMDEMAVSNEEDHSAAGGTDEVGGEAADFENFNRGSGSVEFGQMATDSISSSEGGGTVGGGEERSPLPRQLPRQDDLEDSDLSDAEYGQYENFGSQYLQSSTSGDGMTNEG